MTDQAAHPAWNVAGLSPRIATWLAANGVPAPRSTREIGSSRARRLFIVDDHVLRWYGDGAFLEEEPDAIDREVAALTALAPTAVPAPRLVAWSREPPAVLQTRLPGEPLVDLPDPGAVDAVLDAIHGVDPAPLRAWSYRGYHEGVDLVRPAWWRDPTAWARAVRQTETARPTAEAVVIHRDFHPGNLLWLDGRLSGVVDWVDACLGPAAFDRAHLRVNLAVLHGSDAEDRVREGDPAWDIEAAFGLLDWPSRAAVDGWPGPWAHLAPGTARARLEAFVGRALARLGSSGIVVS